MEWNNRCYFFETTARVSPPEARQACQAKHPSAKLANIGSDLEQNFLAHHALELRKFTGISYWSGYWIGE